ncbi:MAG: 6-bladed beta-propeller [Candidatus Aminicenantes bacterium]|nr:6-bladed beta-propeller [Candidatus Aminicenantes bacterium]
MKKLSRLILLFLVVLLINTAYSAGAEKALWSFSYFEEDDFFFRPSDMDVDRALRLIYIADSGNHRVVVFDFDGKFVRIIGQQGQGPAEFSRPTGLHVFDGGRLAVADVGNNRIQLFDRTGQFLRSINTKEVRVADLIVEGDLFYTIPSFGASGFNLNMGSKEDSQPLIMVLDNEGSMVLEITTSEFPEKHPFIRAVKHRVSLALSPQKKLFLSYFAANVIHVFDLKGEKDAEFDRPMPFHPIVPKLEEQKTVGGGKGSVIQMRATLDMVSRACHFGTDGMLYILTHSESYSKRSKSTKKPEDIPPSPMHFDVIDPNTHKLIRTISCDAGAQVFTVLDKNHLAYIYEDAEGEIFLKCVMWHRAGTG